MNTTEKIVADLKETAAEQATTVYICEELPCSSANEQKTLLASFCKERNFVYTDKVHAKLPNLQTKEIEAYDYTLTQQYGPALFCYVNMGKYGWAIFTRDTKVPANTFLGGYAGDLFIQPILRNKLEDKKSHYRMAEVNPETSNLQVTDALERGNLTRFIQHGWPPTRFHELYTM